MYSGYLDQRTLAAIATVRTSGALLWLTELDPQQAGSRWAPNEGFPLDGTATSWSTEQFVGADGKSPDKFPPDRSWRLTATNSQELRHLFAAMADLELIVESPVEEGCQVPARPPGRLFFLYVPPPDGGLGCALLDGGTPDGGCRFTIGIKAFTALQK